jgi:transposase
MGNEKRYRAVRELCEKAYTEGETDPAKLAHRFKVTENTVRGWIRKGQWKTERETVQDLEKSIDEQMRKAYLTALQRFNDDPDDTNLQSLVALLKARQNTTEPGRQYLDFIVKFLDQATDYMIERQQETLLKLFQENVHDLADYLRLKNA